MGNHFTVLAWVRPAAGHSAGRHSVLQLTGGVGFAVDGASGALRGTVSGVTYASGAGASVAAGGEWHHVALVVALSDAELWIDNDPTKSDASAGSTR